MEQLSVIGCGTMGHSIALAAAWAKLPVQLIGMNDEELLHAKKQVDRKLQTMVEEGLLEEIEKEAVQQRILYTSTMDAVAQASFIIEAIPETLSLKYALYEQLEQLVADDTIIASNTSGFMPSVLAAHMRRAERFIVAHYWNPAHLIPLVEVVKGERTDEATIDRTMAYMRAMNKEPIFIAKEIVGFIGNRMQYALFREAQAILQSGAATVEDIDLAVTMSIGRRLSVTGPFMTADLGGLDVFSSISNYLFADLSKADTSSEVVMELVAAGKLGDKTGVGFYKWDEVASEAIHKQREQMLMYHLKQQGGQVK